MSLAPYDFVRFMIDFGMRLDNVQAASIMEYFRLMQENGRLIAVSSAGTLEAFCTFFLCKDDEEIEQWHTRPMWSMRPDSNGGTIVYIDKLIAKTYTPSIRKQIQDVLLWRFPQLERAVWFRPMKDSPDRKVMYLKKEAPHVVQIHG